MACFPDIGRRFGRAVGLSLAAVLLSSGIVGASEGPPLLRASIQNGLLTLEARGVSRSEVLHAIGREAGFRVFAATGETGLVELSLLREPVARAVTRLLQGTSAVMVYEPDRDSGPDRLSEVHLLGPNDEPAQARRIETDHGRAARLRAIHALDGQADPVSVAALALAAVRDPEPTVRRAAVDALGKLRTAKARATLIVALSDDDPHVGRRAAAGLVRTWGEKAAPSLAQVLAGAEIPETRRLAADALGRIGGETALSALLDAQSDPEPRVRQAVAAGLARHQESPG